MSTFTLIMLSVALSVECIIAHEAWFFSENPSISSGAIRMSDPRDHEDTIIMYAIYMDKYFTNVCACLCRLCDIIISSTKLFLNTIHDKDFTQINTSMYLILISCCFLMIYIASIIAT